FVLIGDYGTYDKNSSYRNMRFRKLLKKLSSRAELGIHPSYGSSKDPDKIHAEVKRLSDIIKKPVVISRQHFLMLDLPASYSCLMNQDIQREYSMGYASSLGFRASISSPFNAYDLVQDKELPVRIHPFAFMDSALSDYLQVLPEDYIKFVRPLIQSVKQVDGELIGIWHNYALSDDETKHHAFTEIIKEAVQ
ncbi:MAG: polysaccharide deacetylase family protein, partial [Bacteroidota bacterium]|nr:polysaccharide deacetylase family protein [Bacteroidota bacterium]